VQRFQLGPLEVKLLKMKSLVRLPPYFDTVTLSSKMAELAFVFRKIMSLEVSFDFIL
jgi:hypothetical protein